MELSDKVDEAKRLISEAHTCLLEGLIDEEQNKNGYTDEYVSSIYDLVVEVHRLKVKM